MAPSTVQANGSQGGIQFPSNGSRQGFENAEISSKFKKKNGRMVQDHIGGQPNHLQNSFNGTNSKGFANQQQLASQNRKLTPNKMNIGIKANSSMAQNTTMNLGRNNFDVKGKQKSNSRSNTIENSMNQYEKESKKNVKRKERASSTLEPSEMQNSQNYNMGMQQSAHQHHNSHLMANAGAPHVQVSQTGTLLIGPGGRPKTS